MPSNSVDESRDGPTRVAPDGRWWVRERPLVNAGRWADGTLGSLVEAKFYESDGAKTGALDRDIGHRRR